MQAFYKNVFRSMQSNIVSCVLMFLQRHVATACTNATHHESWCADDDTQPVLIKRYQNMASKWHLKPKKIVRNTICACY